MKKFLLKESEEASKVIAGVRTDDKAMTSRKSNNNVKLHSINIHN